MLRACRFITAPDLCMYKVYADITHTFNSNSLGDPIHMSNMSELWPVVGCGFVYDCFIVNAKVEPNLESGREPPENRLAAAVPQMVSATRRSHLLPPPT